MSNPRTIRNIFLNTESLGRGILSGTSWQSAQTLSFYVGSQSLIQATLLLNDGVTKFLPPAGATWLSGFNTKWAEAQSPEVVSLNDQFVYTDWSVCDVGFDNGFICWRMDWTTTPLKTILDNSPTVAGYMDLWMIPVGGYPVLIAQWPATVNNIAVDPTTATPVTGITYPTTDVLVSMFNQLTNPTGGLYRIKNGAVQLKNSTTGLFQTIALSGASGSETEDFGPGEV